MKKKEFEKSPCLEGIGLGFKSVCSRSPDGDIVVTFPAQEAEVPQIFIDVDDMMQIKPGYVKNKRSVEKIIMSKKAYLGGMYGSYGGYDFIIIKVSEPMPGELAACLPGLQYSAGQDIMIGGYGRYRRVPCETTDKGPQVKEIANEQRVTQMYLQLHISLTSALQQTDFSMPSEIELVT